MAKGHAKVWFDTPFPGVRCRKHPARKHGVKRDSYFQVRYQKDGKRREEALGWASDGMTAQKAALILAELKEASRTGKGESTLAERRQKITKAREEEAAGKVTFKQFWEKEYMPHAMTEKTNDTLKSERSLFKCWLNPIFGPLPFGEISVIRMEQLKSKITKAGRSARRVEYALAVTRQVINEAKRRGIFTGENVVKRIRFPKVDNRRLRFLTPSEAEALLSVLSKTDRTAWEMTLLSLYCGMRAGEILRLTFGDIDLGRGLITIRDSKSGRSRFAHMTETVKEIFQAKGQGDPSGLLYPGAGGRIRSEAPRTFQKAVEQLGFNAGRTDRRDRIVFHSCRHSFASWLVQRGVDLYTVKELLGHSTLAMVMRYAHLADANLIAAVDTLTADPNGRKTDSASGTGTEGGGP